MRIMEAWTPFKGVEEGEMEESVGAPRGPLGTAAQLEEEGGMPSAWERRLEGIEERQRRIEEMLIEISQSLKR